jgi:hypothetical protein
MRTALVSLALATALTTALAVPASAGTKSVYSDFIFGKCKRLTPETSGDEGESSGIVECKGLPGYPVTFVEGDLRAMVAFGRNGEDHCAFHQTFGGFNSVGSKVEWRLKDGKPIATIFRWTVSYDPENSEKTKTWLVVTKLEKNNSCHMAYVEGAYPKANETAQKIADTLAAGFSCRTSKPTFIANSGTATDSIAANDGCRDE